MKGSLKRDFPVAMQGGTADEPRLYGIDALAKQLDVSRRSIERARALGEFPPPDRHIGKRPLWSAKTIVAWIGGERHESRG